MSEVSIVTPKDVTSVNQIFSEINLSCDNLLSGLTAISIPTSTKVDLANNAQQSCKAANKVLQEIVEKRKQISRILDGGKERLMEPEKKVQKEINRIMAELTAWERKRQEDERVEKEKREKERLKQERIIKGAAHTKLCLESIIVEVKVKMVDRFPEFLKKNIQEKNSESLVSVEQVGNFNGRYNSVKKSALSQMPNEAERNAASEMVDADEQYVYKGFLSRVNAELAKLLQDAMGPVEAQQNFYTWASTADEADVDFTLTGIKDNLAALVPQYQKVKESVVNASGSAVGLVDKTVADKINGAATVEIVKATLTEKKVISDVQTNGVAQSYLTQVDGKDALMALVKFYLDQEGVEGYGKVVKNLDFILTYAAKKQPVINGVRYKEQSKVTLR